MNRTLVIAATLAAGLAAGAAGGYWYAMRNHDAMPSRPTAADTAKNGKRVLYWYDPMHPEYKADKPGKAPDCGMDLVPKYADDMQAN